MRSHMHLTESKGGSRRGEARFSRGRDGAARHHYVTHRSTACDQAPRATPAFTIREPSSSRGATPTGDETPAHRHSCPCRLWKDHATLHMASRYFHTTRLDFVGQRG